MSAKHVISYDIGTTGVKTCLFEIDDTITLKSAAMEGYNLYILPDGGAELDPTGKKAGRGAYICRSAECLKKARKAKRLERNLEVTISDEVYEELERGLSEK